MSRGKAAGMPRRRRKRPHDMYIPGQMEEADVRPASAAGWLYLGQGDLLWSQGKNLEALECYARASESDPDPEIHRTLEEKLSFYRLAAAESCESLLLEGETASARETAALWLRIFPEDKGLKRVAGATAP